MNALTTPVVRDPLQPLDAALAAALELPIPPTQRAQVRACHSYWCDFVRAGLRSVAHADLADQHRDADALYAIAEGIAREGAVAIANVGRVR
jgi:hypothetical protein